MLNLALKILDYRVQPFVAPVPEMESVTVWTVQEGVPYQYQVRVDPGWYEFSPSGYGGFAPMSREAHVFEYMGYLEQLPRFYVIVLFRVGETSWWVVPHNSGDAAQRGWGDCEPRLMHLAQGMILPFSVVDARVAGGIMLFRCAAPQLGGENSNRCRVAVGNRDPGRLVQKDFYFAYQTVVTYLDARAEEAREHRAKVAQLAEEERRRKMTEDREYGFRYMLSLAGAEMRHLIETGGRYEVQWSKGGRTFRTQVNPDMRVHAAGICLAGTAGNYNLATIVPVMERAVELNRYDMEFDRDGVQVWRGDPHDDW